MFLKRSLQPERLMTLEEYVDVEHEVPFTYTCADGDVVLSVFGSDHSNNPAHKQFSAIEEQFANNTPDIVLVEGLQDELVFAHFHELLQGFDRDEVIMHGGESVFSAWLALQAGVGWQSVEPEDSSLFRSVEKLGFKRMDILAWALVRLLPQFVRRQESVTFLEYIEPFQMQIAVATGWSEALLDGQELLQHAVSIVGADVSLHSETQAERYTSPLATVSRDGDYTVLNSIAAVATEYRDRAMLETIVQAADTYQSLFVVYGASHAVRQERVLRDRFCK